MIKTGEAYVVHDIRCLYFRLTSGGQTHLQEGLKENVLRPFT